MSSLNSNTRITIKNFSCYTSNSRNGTHLNSEENSIKTVTNKMEEVHNENKKVLSRVIGEIIKKIKSVQSSIQKFIMKEKEIVTYYEQQKTKINSLFNNIARKIDNIKKSYIERINFLYSEQEKLFTLNQKKITLFNDKINQIQNVYENININDVEVIKSSKEETNLQLDNIIKDFNDFFHSTSSNMMIFPYFLPPSSFDISNEDFGEIKYTNDISVNDNNTNWLNMSECVFESKDWSDTLSQLKNNNNIFNQNLFNEIDDRYANERLCSVQNIESDDKIETSDTEYKACHTTANTRAKPPICYKRDISNIKTQRNKSKKQLMKEYDDSLETNRKQNSYRQNQSAKQSKRNIKIYDKEEKGYLHTESKKSNNITNNIKIKGRNFSFNKKTTSTNTIITKKKIVKSNNIKLKNNIIPFNHKKVFK